MYFKYLLLRLVTFVSAHCRITRNFFFSNPLRKIVAGIFLMMGTYSAYGMSKVPFVVSVGIIVDDEYDQFRKQGDELFKAGQYEKALKKYLSCLEVPGFERDMYAMGRVDVCRKAAEMKLEIERLNGLGQLEDATASIDALLILNPADEQTRNTVFAYWLNKGNQAMYRKRWQEASDNFINALAYKADGNLEKKLQRCENMLVDGDVVRPPASKEAVEIKSPSSGVPSKVAISEKVVTPVALTAEIVKFLDLPFSDMVYVSGGGGKMGDSTGKPEEQPVHVVRVGSFWMGKYEVTQAQWEAVMGNNPSKFRDCPNCPVENVSWLEAVAFCNTLSTLEERQLVYTINGKNVTVNWSANGYRLPTEAEWEYAARGGNKSQGNRYAGGNELASVGWFEDNSENKTKVVGRKEPNELGLYDMTGNVWEWCNDWYGDDYYASSPSSDPQGPSSGFNRVLRGGGWRYSAYACRVAIRGYTTPDDRHPFLGFRLVLSQ